MKMTVVDGNTLTQLRVALNAALAPVAKAHGITLTLGRCSYTRTGQFTFKLEGVAAGSVDRDAQAWRDYAPLYKWDADLVGKPVRYGAREYTLHGYAPRGDNVLLLREGRVYKLKRAALVGMVPV